LLEGVEGNQGKEEDSHLQATTSGPSPPATHRPQTARKPSRFPPTHPPNQTRVPRSQRGGEVVEPLVSDQWFVRMAPLAAPALAAVAGGEVRIVPERFEKVYNFWLEGIKVGFNGRKRALLPWRPGFFGVGSEEVREGLQLLAGGHQGGAGAYCAQSGLLRFSRDRPRIGWVCRRFEKVCSFLAGGHQDVFGGGALGVCR
jgi:hypothetical protein